MDRTFPKLRYKTRSAQEQALAEAAGIKWATVQRIIYQDRDKATAATLDTIADIAAALEVRGADLLDQAFADKLATTLTPAAESETLQRRPG